MSTQTEYCAIGSYPHDIQILRVDKLLKQDDYRSKVNLTLDYLHEDEEDDHHKQYSMTLGENDEKFDNYTLNGVAF